MQAALHFADVEIRILPEQPDGFPIEITFTGEQAFAGGFPATVLGVSGFMAPACIGAQP